MRRLPFIFCELLLAVQVLSCSTDIYVSAGGDDLAAGTRNHPYATVEKAFSEAQRIMDSGCRKGRIILEEGEYRISGSVRLDGSDWSGSLLVEGPGTICGDVRVTGWKPLSAIQNPVSDGRYCFPDSLSGCVLVAHPDITDYGNVGTEENRFDLYADGVRQIPARWPNDAYVRMGVTLGADRAGEYPHASNQGYMQYSQDRMSCWTGEKDPWCYGWWQYEWSDGYVHINQLDTLGRTVRFDDPCPDWGYRDYCRFYGINLLCELDTPGEYYLDRDSGTLYWYPPYDSPEASVSVFNEDFMVYAVNCKHLSFKRLSFRGSRGGAICVEGGTVDISSCNFCCFGNTVISFAGGLNHVVDGCDFSQLGTAGIFARGGDRKTLEPYGLVIRNCVFDGFGLFKRSYRPAVNFGGAGVSITHNEFRNSPSSALRLDGNDLDISYNIFSDVVTESDDQGAIDVYNNFSFRGIYIHDNWFRNICGGFYVGRAGVRFDDIISGEKVVRNIFENCGGKQFGGVQINGGKDNYIANNLFYNCFRLASFINYGHDEWVERIRNNQPYLEAVDFWGELYRSRYPELSFPYDENIGVNTVENNLVVNSDDLFFEGDRVKGENNTLLEGEADSLKYYLRPSVLSSYGLDPIPYEKIGPGR